MHLLACIFRSTGDLIGTIKQFFIEIGIPSVRFKPAFNPYTEPSMEIFGFHPHLKKWIELGNSGMFRPEMLLPMGLPPNVRVIAWGLSVERPTMIKYGVNDIRKLFGHKIDLDATKATSLTRLEVANFAPENLSPAISAKAGELAAAAAGAGAGSTAGGGGAPAAVGAGSAGPMGGFDERSSELSWVAMAYGGGDGSDAGKGAATKSGNAAKGAGKPKDKGDKKGGGGGDSGKAGGGGDAGKKAEGGGEKKKKEKGPKAAKPAGGKGAKSKKGKPADPNQPEITKLDIRVGQITKVS
jgi:hypothetical protein